MMAADIIYQEVQPSGSRPLRRFFLITAVFLLVSSAASFFLNKLSSPVITGLFTGSVICFIGALVSFLRMVTQVRTDGIYVRYFPFQPSFQKFSWSDILDVYPRSFDALTEYGGWGIRITPFGKAYIISGNQGIQIVFHDKKRLLISTRQPDELMSAIHTVRDRNML
jgi:hypothetical protein